MKPAPIEARYRKRDTNYFQAQRCLEIALRIRSQLVRRFAVCEVAADRRETAVRAVVEKGVWRWWQMAMLGKVGQINGGGCGGKAGREAAEWGSRLMLVSWPS